MPERGATIAAGGFKARCLALLDRVAAAVARGRISLDRDPLEWIEQALALPRLQRLPLTPAIAVKATRLGQFHGDPADRLIVATALIDGATLVTRDKTIRQYAPLSCIW